MPVKDTGKDKRQKNLGVYSEGRLWKTYFFFSESRNSLGEQPRTRLTYREKAGNDEKFIFWARSVNETSSAESSLRSIIAAYSSIQSPAGRFVASLLTSVRYLGVTPSLFAYQATSRCLLQLYRASSKNLTKCGEGSPSSWYFIANWEKNVQRS